MEANQGNIVDIWPNGRA